MRDRTPVSDSSPVRAPRPLLSARAEAALGPRHRAVLDRLEDRFLEEGFADVTMRELAAYLRCSLRTLYEIAPSKQQLVLVVLDRFLHRVGRTALSSIDPEASVVERIRTYLRSGGELRRWTSVFAEDAADAPDVLRLLDHHLAYLNAVLVSLIAEGIEEGEMRAVDARLAAGVLTGAAMMLTRPDVDVPTGDEAVDAITDLVLYGIVDDGFRSPGSGPSVGGPAKH